MGRSVQQNRGDMNDDSLKILKEIPLFDGVSEDSLQLLDQAASIRSYRKKEALCRPNEPFNALFYLLEGLVQLSLTDPQGKEVSLMILSSGHWFGELSLLDGRYQPTTIVAVEPSRALVLPRQTFLDLLNKDPTIALEMLTYAYRRLYHVLAHVKRIQFGDAYQRVARVLLALADEYGTEHTEGIRLKFRLTHQVFADLNALTRETATQTLSAFRVAGCLKEDDQRHWIITDRKKLEREAG
ncbi:MAG: Crp/Fnr family transcriptional regulator [Nitrospirae bacterium]|nr:Crp/Fnr family transcriptional regulator [Nitrospirota bacterium]